MTMARTTVVPGTLEGYRDFATLLRSLDDALWAAPSRCEGWTVAGVAAHVTGQLTDVVNLRLDGLGSPEATQRQVDERAGRSQFDLAQELELATKTAEGLLAAFDDDAWGAEAPGGVAGTLGSGIEALWFDTFVHADDIRNGVGAPSVRSGGAVAGSVSHIADELTKRGWGPATLCLDGIDEFPVSGGGTAVTGDPFEFILASTGRGDPAALGLDATVNIYG
ncbi:MAG: maleylpyruvate isomerase family mycothiol-dependent enzyme [Acidimicrobiales bacterium]